MTMQQFGINGIGQFLIQKQTKVIGEFIWSGILLFVVFYLGIRYGLGSNKYLIIMYLWAIFISLTISVFFPIYIKNIIKKVILRIEFTERDFKIETNKGVFYLTDIEIRKVRGHFNGFGKNHKNGYILKDSKLTKEYWLIETFFNEFEDIQCELERYMENINSL